MWARGGGGQMPGPLILRTPPRHTVNVHTPVQELSQKS